MGGLLLINLICLLIKTDRELLLKYLFPVVTIGVAYGNASTPIRRGGGADGQFFPRRRAVPCFPALPEPADPKAGRRIGRTVIWRGGFGVLSGSVTIGVLPTIAPYLLPRVITGFMKQFPGVDIIVHEDTTAQLLKLALAYEIDFALASHPLHDERLAIRELFTEELLLALPPGHPLRRKRTVNATDLEGERLIIMKEGHCLGDQVLRFCGRSDGPAIRARRPIGISLSKTTPAGAQDHCRLAQTTPAQPRGAGFIKRDGVGPGKMTY